MDDAVLPLDVIVVIASHATVLTCRALIMTCQALHCRVVLKPLPPEWRPMWRDFKVLATPVEVVAAREAIADLVDAGVSQWPGIFRLGAAKTYQASDRAGTTGLMWRWYHGGGPTPGTYVAWTWRYRLPDPWWFSRGCYPTLAKFLEDDDKRSDMQEFLALANRRTDYDMQPLHGERGFNHD